jgi:hypothetical protein
MINKVVMGLFSLDYLKSPLPDGQRGFSLQVLLRRKTAGLDFLARASRADVHAGGAILALGGVDDVDPVTFGDGVLGAFGFAGAAADAIGRDLVSHVISFQWLFGTYKGIG